VRSPEHQVGAAKTSKAALDKWTSSEFSKRAAAGKIAQNVIDADLKGFAVGSLLLDWRIDFSNRIRQRAPLKKLPPTQRPNHCFRSSRIAPRIDGAD